MAKQKTRSISLKHGLIALVGVCWVLPVLLILLLSGYFIRKNLQTRIEDTIVTSVDNALALTEDNIDAALAASRAASYDNVIQRAWVQYGSDRDGVQLYTAVTEYLSQQYSYDENFNGAMLFFIEEPDMIYYTSNRSNTGKTDPLRKYVGYAHETAIQVAKTLSTDVHFFEAAGALYLIRNIVDSAFQPFAAIIMECDEEALFKPLKNIVWLTDATVEIDGIDRVIAGGGALPGENDEGWYLSGDQTYRISRTLRASDYSLRLAAYSDGANLTDELPDSTRIMLLIVALAVPLLLFVIWAFYRYVTKPLATLVDAARHVAAGERGYKIAPLPASREFRSLTEHFNGMSDELKTQFERSYEEQLALQDARVKALQSQINPHFLNNTLEIINWEARMANDEKASRMIEALSTMLDAATARGGSAVVALSEELKYVDSYLYILSERYGERLHVDKMIDETLLYVQVPRLILQPIVENAFEHGIEQRASGSLTLRIFAEEATLVVEVENDGSMSEQDRENIRRLLSWDGAAVTEKERFGRIGIRNVNRRLKILYGEKNGLTIREVAPGRILARITLPIETLPHEDEPDGNAGR